VTDPRRLRHPLGRRIRPETPEIST